MEIVAEIELETAKELRRNQRTSLASLFSYTERTKRFELLSDVKSGSTKLKLEISKLTELETKAATTKAKGQSTHLLELLFFPDTWKQLEATQEIGKGEKLKLIIKKIGQS